jgi:anti-anti-sigma factor
MPAATATALPCPAIPFDDATALPPWEGRTAQLTCRWLSPSVAAVSAHGEIDATNAGNLTEYACGVITHCRGLILDLSDLNFLGTEGISTLHTVGVRCARARVDYAVVPSTAVSRLLRVCDPHGSVPAAGTVDEALAAFVGEHARPEAVGR